MWNWLEKASELSRQGAAFAIVTVIDVKGSAPRDVGAKLIVLPSGEFFGTVGGGRLEEAVLADAQKALTEAQAARGRYPLCLRAGQCCGGSVETLIEIFGVGPDLYLFGVGHVGTALAQTLEGTPFRVHAIDDRPEWIDSGKLPAGVIRHKDGAMAFLEKARFDRDTTYAIVMTHDHALDLEITAALARKPARYIGLIGSHHKWERFQQRLKSLGLGPDEIARVQCPLGLPLGGGKAPREVAISAAAQLLQLHYGG